jgi:hypothetical protein
MNKFDIQELNSIYTGLKAEYLLNDYTKSIMVRGKRWRHWNVYVEVFID